MAVFFLFFKRYVSATGAQSGRCMGANSVVKCVFIDVPVASNLKQGEE